MNQTERNPISFRIILAWVIVLIPLGWGVYQSVVKSLPLLRVSEGGK